MPNKDRSRINLVEIATHLAQQRALWEPLVLLAVYAPAGAEQVLKTLPDYREVPPGEAPPVARS